MLSLVACLKMFFTGIMFSYALLKKSFLIPEDLATIVESLTLGAEGNNCMSELGNTSFTNMEMGPTSITDITKPYPAKEPVPETTAQEVRKHLRNYHVMYCLFSFLFSNLVFLSFRVFVFDKRRRLFIFHSLCKYSFVNAQHDW